MPVPDQAWHVSISDRHIVSQELWPASDRNADRTPRARLRHPGSGSAGPSGSRRRAQTALSDRAGSPPLLAVPREPPPDGRVVHMGVPHECDERVHLEKRPAHHSSSSARRTISGVDRRCASGNPMTVGRLRPRCEPVSVLGGQLRDHPAKRSVLFRGKLSCCLEDVFIEVERCAHDLDAIASAHQTGGPEA